MFWNVIFVLFLPEVYCPFFKIKYIPVRDSCNFRVKTVGISNVPEAVCVFNLNDALSYIMSCTRVQFLLRSYKNLSRWLKNNYTVLMIWYYSKCFRKLYNSEYLSVKTVISKMIFSGALEMQNAWIITTLYLFYLKVHNYSRLGLHLVSMKHSLRNNIFRSTICQRIRLFADDNLLYLEISTGLLHSSTRRSWQNGEVDWNIANDMQSLKLLCPYNNQKSTDHPFISLTTRI